MKLSTPVSALDLQAASPTAEHSLPWPSGLIGCQEIILCPLSLFSSALPTPPTGRARCWEVFSYPQSVTSCPRALNATYILGDSQWVSPAQAPPGLQPHRSSRLLKSCICTSHWQFKLNRHKTDFHNLLFQKTSNQDMGNSSFRWFGPQILESALSFSFCHTQHSTHEQTLLPPPLT